ncbi:cob(I)yrinic acid a,c-diamide adenosyltransferase [Periweissella cryptocerci]|uniref:Corrinoid adenosyltransferase n=1 Tax=Periweissella cryptocerci TaxID=2506420 RepID=A0A4P6YT73_9LACO|nr:cob(I)yrinic acid a,c-diamide adenosyltransferase [Periweissella cryptocerci]QBO35948.1 cob(I)yrinic acid a,c-diamide adenosyltransferase [Periweissella cryptocerci]
MSIYTKTGDKGTTGLFDGGRVAKYSERVETYGTFDECNAQISFAEKFCKVPRNKDLLKKIQNKLFLVGGEIATEDPTKFYAASQVISEMDTTELESIIDEYTAMLPEIHSFILPGVTLAGAQLHVARTVCRRAERGLVRFSNEAKVRPELLRYANRLSDFLYILARSEDNYQVDDDEVDQIVKQYNDAIGNGEE